jgi:50S ribosomal protein L16 3-hydroxylase
MLEPGLSPRRFLQQYWQKAPLLLRGAVSGGFGLSGDVLAGLACEDDVESRLVLGSVERGFRLEHGPFEAKRFRRLPRREWTLLVQDVDQHVPRVVALFEGVSFIPQWRVDDVMVSYAVPGGSVGPHVDAYDVFLVQLQGERLWQLSTQQDLELQSGAELKLLERFRPEVEHVVGPGDVLYLPPGLAHYGLAQSECLTASVGFRAPSQDELLADFLQEVATGASLERYGDPELKASRDATELRQDELAALRALIRSGLSVSDERIDDFVGRYLTRLKPRFEAALTSPDDAASARSRRALGAPDASLVRRRGSRWLHFASAGGPRWFVNGEQLAAPRLGAGLLRELAAGRPVPVSKLGAAAPLLEALLRLGGVEVKRAARAGRTTAGTQRASTQRASTQRASAARPARRTGASRRTR